MTEKSEIFWDTYFPKVGSLIEFLQILQFQMHSSFGLFWFSFAALTILPALGLTKDTGGANAMAAYLALWGLFTLILFIGSLKMSRALQFVLGTLALLFFLESAGIATSTGMFTIIAGYIGVISGLAAIYTALAPVLNDIYGKTVVPLG